MNDIYESYILTDLEMKVAATILGYPQWNDIDVLDPKDDLDQRIPLSLLSLMDKGFLRIDKDRYTPTELLKTIMYPICCPKRIWYCLENEGLLKAVYAKGNSRIMMNLYPHTEGAYSLTIVNADIMKNDFLPDPDSVDIPDYLCWLVDEKRDTLSLIRIHRENEQLYMQEQKDSEEYPYDKEKLLDILEEKTGGVK